MTGWPRGLHRLGCALIGHRLGAQVVVAVRRRTRRVTGRCRRCGAPVVRELPGAGGPASGR